MSKRTKRGGQQTTQVRIRKTSKNNLETHLKRAHPRKDGRPSTCEALSDIVDHAVKGRP